MSLVIIIIIVTVAISWQANQNMMLKERMLFVPYFIKHDREYHRLISHIFIHADLMHLAFNMLSLYSLGSMFESQLEYNFGFQSGIIHFAILYFVGGIFASFYSYMKHQDNPSYRSLGASGAVSAVIFASIIWNPDLKLMIMFIPVPIPAYLFGPIYLAIEYFAMRKGNTGIAHEAHISGALFGVLYVTLLDFDRAKQFLDLIF
jgi:membrane associated rhomboid family serine protease